MKLSITEQYYIESELNVPENVPLDELEDWVHDNIETHETGECVWDSTVVESVDGDSSVEFYR